VDLEPGSKVCHEPRRKLLTMTVTINANSTLRRHCEAKEKITGEKKFICRSNLILR